MAYELKTIKGYDFYEAASALQKAIRRADHKVAGFFALELWSSNYVDYVWKRLLTISAEDCYGLLTKEIMALHDAYEFVTKGKTGKGRIFISKAVLLLCDVRKSRDADHLQNFIYDRDDVEIDKWIEDVRRNPIPVPEYTFDVHTKRGKMRGKTKEQFFRDEFKALKPREEGLFDSFFSEQDREEAKVNLVQRTFPNDEYFD